MSTLCIKFVIYVVYLRVQYLGSSDESPQSFTLLQNRVRVTQWPFSHLNSDILHDGPALIANMEK